MERFNLCSGRGVKDYVIGILDSFDGVRCCCGMVKMEISFVEGEQGC